MALVDCVECGQKRSNDSLSCAQCGKVGFLTRFVVVLVVMASMLQILGFGFMGK